MTVGAVGSHHVLATGLFARQVGLAVDAVLVPQPATPHVTENLRATLALGVNVLPASRPSRTRRSSHPASRLGRRVFYIPVGVALEPNRCSGLRLRSGQGARGAGAGQGTCPSRDVLVRHARLGGERRRGLPRGLRSRASPRAWSR